MKHSDTLAAIAPALVTALAKIEGAAKDKVNPAFKSKYANLESVIEASRDVLADNGLTLIQLPGACAEGVQNLETIFMHTSGEWISGEMGIALGKTDPQGVGSALTYARRYAQMAALNMPAVDDDGERAMGRADGKPVAEPKPPSLASRKPEFEKLEKGIDACQTVDDLSDWGAAHAQEIGNLPGIWKDGLRDRFAARRAELIGAAGIAEAEAELDAGFRGAVGGAGSGGMARNNGHVQAA